MKNNKSGRFFELPKTEICNSSSHNPPSHLYIPNGKGYKHVCLKCGNEIVIKGSLFTL